MKIKQGDTLLSKNGVDEVKIIDAPKPPKKWTIRFLNGRTQLRSKTFLKNYYNVVER